MEDSELLALFRQRDERAIGETRQKYGPYLTAIARGIVSNRQDAEEIVSDTCLRAWNAIPPERPARLSAWLGKITRRLAIDALRTRTRTKRGAQAYALSLSELEECVPDRSGPEEALELSVLAQALNDWLYTLTPTARGAFLARYFYMDPIRRIAGSLGMSESGVKSLLYRTRQELKKYLTQEGFTV